VTQRQFHQEVAKRLLLINYEDNNINIVKIVMVKTTLFDLRIFSFVENKRFKYML